jgi:hypothetical protein
MDDNRRSDRTLTLLTGKVLAPSLPHSVDCAVLNISQSGACILVPKDAEISERFVLQIDDDRRSCTCKMVWRNGSRIGLTFDGPE